MMSPVSGRLVLAATFVAASGCAHGPLAEGFPEPDESWKSFSGQLQYITPGNSVIGEFVASRKAQDFHLEFSKGGGIALIKVSRYDQFARAEGPLARGRWQGTAATAPAALHGWVEQVPQAFFKLDDNTQQPTGPTHSGRRAPQRLEIPGGRDGEKFIFILNR